VVVPQPSNKQSAVEQEGQFCVLVKLIFFYSRNKVQLEEGGLQDLAYNALI
jgi:hypothetical protein